MGEEGEVHLKLPAETRFLRLARLVAAGMASDRGFAVRALEDLRIAVDEACAVLLESPGAEHDCIQLVYRADDDQVSIEGSCPGDGSGPIEVHPVARALLRMSTDEHQIDAGGGLWQFRLVKRITNP